MHAREESPRVGPGMKRKYRNWFKSLQSSRGKLGAIVGESRRAECGIEGKADRYPSRPPTELDAVGHGKCLRPITAPEH